MEPAKPQQPTPMTQEQMLQEILVNSRKTKNYIKWQMIITIALVVIPLLASLILIPYAMKSLTSIYDISGTGNGDAVQNIIDQYTK